MKGLILAGGAGTRLHPLTQVVSKQLLPVYDKPMIYYPISVLMLAGIRELLLISTPQDLPLFQTLLGDGRRFGLDIQYAAQPSPDGLPQAFLIGEAFLAGSPSALILGDNLFFGQGFSPVLHGAAALERGARIFAYQVQDPERYGVVEFDAAHTVLSLEEKPKAPRSTWAVPGLYFFDGSAPVRARALRPSARGELEITDLIRTYLEEGTLRVFPLGRGFAWLDTGTHDNLLEAGSFVATLQRRQGLAIACLEEIAFDRGWITREQVLEAAAGYAPGNGYGATLRRLVERG